MMNPVKRVLALSCTIALVLACAALPAHGEDPTEDDYYPIVEIPIPEDINLEVGALEWLPDGILAVTTRRGDIYLVENVLAEDTSTVKFQKFASGFHQPFGLVQKDGFLYATQRSEVTKIVDTDGDGEADLYETLSDFWETAGGNFEWAWGTHFDKDDNIYVILTLDETGAPQQTSDFRGWCLRVNIDGTTTPFASGIRSPGGIGFNAVGDLFYADNQGEWNGTNFRKWIRPGYFTGNPSGNNFYALTDAIGPRPRDPENGSRIMIEAKKIPEYEPPAIMFPYYKMGQSAGGIVCDTTGKFGPFAEQLFVADQAHSLVMRVYLEKVKGHYQGACFRFREGLSSGPVPLIFPPDGNQGSLIVGQTNRGWGSTGRKSYALERLDWTGKIPFEIHEMHAKPDGFEFTFTHDVDPETLANHDSYNLETYTYIYRAGYGSPEVDRTIPTITNIVGGEDKRSARLYIDRLQEGHVHEFHLDGIRSADGLPLLHSDAYCTLNYIS